MRRCLALGTDVRIVVGRGSEDIARARARLAELFSDPAASPCARVLSAMLIARDPDPNALTRGVIAELDQAAAMRPDVLDLWVQLLRVSVIVDPAGARAVCDRALRTVTSSLGRMELSAQCAGARLVSGDTAGAVAAYLALEDAVRRDGRPGLRQYLIEASAPELQQAADPSRTAERVMLERLQLAESAGDDVRTLSAAGMLGRWRLERGDPAGALPLLDRAVQMAMTGRSTLDRSQTLTWRGRALARLGLLDSAITELRRAVQFGVVADDPYTLAEAWHNLAHAYERAERWPEAAAAADRFVATTESFRWNAAHVIALRDAGEIKRKAGWPAAAETDYQRMVAAVRAQNANHQWAGEYLERRGRLREALAMYQTGAARPSVDPLDVAGMARTYRALGRLDSAAAAARRHDGLRHDWRPSEVPLLPDLMAARGDVTGATRALQEWAEARLRGADQQGAAAALLAWGRMAYRGADLETAMAASVRAESLAGRSASPAEAAGARLLRARILSRRGEHDSAAAFARRTARELAQADLPLLRIEALGVLGEIHARRGERARALAAFGEAADLVDAVSAGLQRDRDRAAYRAEQLLPFDHALTLLLRESPTDDAAILAWSARRKAAALRLSLGGGTPPAAPPLSRVQRTLDAHTLLLDYIVLDSLAAVVVVTRRSVRTIPLDRSRDALATMSDRVVRGMSQTWGGRVDAARIRVDSAALRALSRALLEPALAELRDAQRVLVSADAAILAVPLEMLPDPAAPARPWLDAVAVAYLPGAWAVGPLTQRASGPVWVAAQPAPGEAAEVAAIRRAWGTPRVSLLAERDATEEAVERGAAGAGVLHFVTHAVDDAVEPDASHLRLAPGAESDGFLHVSEIARWNRTAPTVILSACATASGAAVAGEGPFSLSRAFLRAGARAVVATHWPVGESASDLTAELHARLARGEPIIDALAAARRKVRGDPARAHPFFWAPFVLTLNAAP